ncbi:unnamed protein product [Closterium sp. NIES-65]|nr:unnamed protein product [Closterium sp. NIES-65]
MSPGRSPNTIAFGWALLAVLLSSAALAEAKTIIVGYGIFTPWRYGISGWKPFRTVQPGDQLLFKWLGEHDVWQFPAKIAQKGTTLYFGCAVGNHCARKMKAKVVVS